MVWDPNTHSESKGCLFALISHAFQIHVCSEFSFSTDPTHLVQRTDSCAWSWGRSPAVNCLQGYMHEYTHEPAMLGGAGPQQFCALIQRKDLPVQKRGCGPGSRCFLLRRQAQPLDHSPTVHCCWMVIGKSTVCPELWSRVKGPPPM
jgi:hypothetical protein